MIKFIKQIINVQERTDPENGIFVLSGIINDALACKLIEELMVYSDRYPSRTITLYIDSEGGKITSGMAIYDIMRFLPNPICTIVTKKAMGIAALLLAAGALGMRLAYPKARIGFGQLYIRADSKYVPKEVITAIEKVFGVLQRLTGRPTWEIKEAAVVQPIMNVEMAIRFGIIDKVKR